MTVAHNIVRSVSSIGCAEDKAIIEIEIPRELARKYNLVQLNSYMALMEISRVISEEAHIDRRIKADDLEQTIIENAVRVDPNRPETWPTVRLTHKPTGLVSSKSARTVLQGKIQALEELNIKVMARAL